MHVSRLHGSFRDRGDPAKVTPLILGKVGRCRVLRRPVIPDNHGSFLPLDPARKVLAARDMSCQECNQVVAFLLAIADDASGIDLDSQRSVTLTTRY